MRYRLEILGIAALAFAGAACQSQRYTTAGFHLPLNGDVERGKAAFVELGCNSCHKVSGVDLPGPTATPPVPVKLGGQSSRRLSDAYLVTAMLEPNYHLAPGPRDAAITAGGHSRMPSFTDKMTVRQMVDIVAFLQSHYVIQRLNPNYSFD